MLTPGEYGKQSTQQAAAAEQRAATAEQRAEVETMRAERLADRLRALGIDPDTQR